MISIICEHNELGVRVLFFHALSVGFFQAAMSDTYHLQFIFFPLRVLTVGPGISTVAPFLLPKTQPFIVFDTL
jgi:hypothetical protein